MTEVTPDAAYKNPATIGVMPLLSGVLAGLIGCGVPLAEGMSTGWSAARIAAYLLVALAYLALISAPGLPFRSVQALCNQRLVFVTLGGLLCLALQALSGDAFIQPIVFTVPFVHLALLYNGAVRPVLTLGTLYLGLLALGQWLHGWRDPAIIVVPVAAYMALFSFMYAFVDLSIKQAAARARADALAAELAQLYQQANLTATLTERNRLARELHDTIAQGLTATSMQIEAAQRAFDRDPERARTRLQRAAELSRATLDDVRRSVWTLAAPLTESGELSAALAAQCAQFQASSGVPTRYTHSGPLPQFDGDAASQVSRIVQEALHNAEKHAQATCVAVETTTAGESFRLTIHDDGQGFDPAAPRAGFGLHSLHERARLAGGELMVESGIGKGTTVQLRIGA
ncbi:MAG: sensor histidine kinase [Roseiflexaceae bacterium]|nr:sensor histidine kinase [Roseiflexaceae bacterium]